MLSESAQNIAKSILALASPIDDCLDDSLLPPSLESIAELAELLASSPGEENLQQFLEQQPQIIVGLTQHAYEQPQGFLVKPSVGTAYKADFAVPFIGQGGCKIALIEIESAHEALFTQSGNVAKRLNGAIRQVSDWQRWIDRNRDTFVRDTLTLLKAMPNYPSRHKNNSFKLRSANHIEQGWYEFGGYDDPIISYTIVIGCWSKLNEMEQRRLGQLNRKGYEGVTIYTYEQAGRCVLSKPIDSYAYFTSDSNS